MPDQAEAVDLQGKYKSEHADGPKERVKRAKESKRRTILPKPRALSVTADVYFEWGASFNEEQNGRAVFHMYREHPVINLMQIGEQKPKLIALNWVPQGSPYTSAKFPFPADMWQEYILTNKQWGGSGSYKLMCTEMGVPGCVCMTKFILEDADYPPCVDPRALDVGHPANKGYIQSLRAQGIKIPGDNPVQEKIDQEEEEEMNVAGQLAETLTKTNERLMDRLEEREDRQPPEVSQPDSLTEATTEGIKVMGEAARLGMGMVVDQAREMTKATAPTWDPVQLFRTGMEARGNDAGMIQMFIASQEKSQAAAQAMQKDFLDFLRERDEEREETSVSVLPQKQGVDLLLEEGAKFKQLGELFGWNRSQRSRDSEPVAVAAESRPNAFERFFDKMAENPAMLISGIALVTNLVQSVLGKGKPPEQVLKEASQITEQLTQSQPQAQNQEQAKSSDKSYLAFMEMIQPIFLENYFDEKQQGLSGYTFAEDFLSMTEAGPGKIAFARKGESELGRNQYDQLKTSGPMGFDRLIRNFAPIWNLIQGNMGKYSMFLKEFFAYDEEAARLAEQKKQTQ